MRICLIIILGICLTSLSYSSKNKTPVNVSHPLEDTVGKPEPPDDGNRILSDSIISHFKNKIFIDSLLISITHQERVKLISELKEEWNEAKGYYQYSDSQYHFVLRKVEDSNACWERNAILVDGKTQIDFKDHHPICLNDTVYYCEDYGFNCDNSLINPKVIEVCGKRYLYSDILYWCNGIGCGCNITLIYDLGSHRAVFLETYRMEFDGYLLSDFDGDNQPDLLVIGQTQGQQMKGLDLEEFQVKLLAYDFNDGLPKEKRPLGYQGPYAFELYTVIERWTHMDHAHRNYSILKENWF
jgi:hypothetical protein